MPASSTLTVPRLPAHDLAPEGCRDLGQPLVRWPRDDHAVPGAQHGPGPQVGLESGGEGGWGVSGGGVAAGGRAGGRGRGGGWG